MSLGLSQTVLHTSAADFCCLLLVLFHCHCYTKMIYVCGACGACGRQNHLMPTLTS